MKPIYRIIFSLLLIAFTSCKKETSEAPPVDPLLLNADFSKILSAYYDGKMALDPIGATGNSDHRFNDSFPNYLSDSYKDSSMAFYTRFKELAEGIDDQKLSDDDKISKEVLLWECHMQLEGLTFRTELFPLNQMGSLNLLVTQYGMGDSAQPFETVEDYENWLRRLDGFVEWLHTAEQRLKEGASIRNVLPSSLIIKVIPQLKPLAEQSVEEHLFYTPVKNFPNTFSEEEKERLREAYATMVSGKLIPAFDSLYEYVSTDYLKAGRNSSGIDALPNGKEYYEYLIKKFTTTDLTAEEIHEIGLKEVERISLEMDSIKDLIGFKGDLKEFFGNLRSDKKLMPFETPEEVIGHFNNIYKRMEPKLRQMFKEAPKTEFVVKRIEEFREASATAHYNSGSLEDERPGIFYVPIPNARNYNTLSDEALFLHEAIPGHHYQFSLAQENELLPEFRKNLWLSAYGEGWALYAESMGKELGLMTDPYQYFGMLSSEMHRAIRLVVDTGLHTKGWTREQAIQYSLDHEAEPKASVISEIERYMAVPGQALSYKIGQLKILSLRDMARAGLGDNFDIKEFHHEVLRHGCIPLDILEKQINQWIDREGQLQ